MTNDEVRDRVADLIEARLGGSKAKRWMHRETWRPLGDATATLNETRTKLVVTDLRYRHVTIAVPIIAPGRRDAAMWAMSRAEFAEMPAHGDGTVDADLEMLEDLIRDAAERLDARRAAIREAAEEAEAEDHAELDLIGVEAAARICGVTVDAIYQQISRGTMPTPIPVDGSRVHVWRRSTIEHWHLTRPRRGQRRTEEAGR